MNVLKSAGLALVLSMMAAGGAVAAECCKKGAPCCEQKEGQAPKPCCKDHAETPKPDAPTSEHQHQH